MNAPRPRNGIAVGLDALRRDAEAWRGVSRELAGPIRQFRELLAVDPTAFSLLAETEGLPAAYAEITVTMTRLLEQATQITNDMGSTLQNAADTYEREDRAGAHRIGDARPGG